ncbi:free methionine-R-sulfoxide reductase [Trichomonascus vanleenenianus]|uniref:L-methionine (R)-S-oxide reductase n=1 Tax=Trichomonascus vanleenenianus TaxID=2268995 RepID=UPI003ECAA6ED
MHHADYTSFGEQSKKEAYEMALMSAEALCDQSNWVANTANIASLLWHMYISLDAQVNWAGFYVQDPAVEGQLILGPFQGKVACQTIKVGSGVCGTAAQSKQTQLVPEVDKFPGHIACDGETKSEIVVPIVDTDGTVRGVIDIDCLALNGFDETDQAYLEKIAQLLIKACKW